MMSMKDVAIIWVDGGGNISVDGEDLLADDSLTNTVIISLFTDRAVNDDELSADQKNAGWWGDSFSDEPWGSRLWLLAREKSLQSVVDDAEDYAYEALQWLIDDHYLDSVVITASRESSQNNAVKDMLHLNIQLLLPNGEPQRALKFIIQGGA